MLPPVPGLGPGMLLEPNRTGAGWLSAPAPTPAGPGAGSDAGRSPWACRAELSRAVPCRDVRSYSLVTFWADAGGSSAQRARSPARTSTLRAMGMVRVPALHLRGRLAGL